MFIKSEIKIVVPFLPDLVLRAASEDDLENLRQWKNEQKEFFFHKYEITSDQQIHWYKSFLERSHDLLFIVEFEGRAFGCMGIRWLEGYWDVYNVILGVSAFGKKGYMGRAFDALLDYTLSLKNEPITLQVLKHNPAIVWYKKHGFSITKTYDEHLLMTFNLKHL
jgi:RimJ/RimL family protein N-acetyltransferase